MKCSELFTGPPTQTQILNPEDEPIFVKKNSVECQTSEQKVSPRLKFKYTVTQTPRKSMMGRLFIVLWMFTMLALFYANFYEKVNKIKVQATEDQENCRQQYQKNKCQKGLKATISFCQQKKKCFAQDSETFLLPRIDLAFLIGLILKDFVSGAGLYVCGIGLVFIWMLARKQSPKQVRKQYVEYC